MEWLDWFGKYVFIQLKSGACYTGTIIDIDKSLNPIIFLELLDKNKKRVIISISEISKIVQEEEKDG